ncbi:hypothetical protein [Flagellimonas sp.]|uniref:hypothetical protein n=1 Tax=Flagellimonas sp. TaxID=2058762 RepID=UPI003B529A90
MINDRGHAHDTFEAKFFHTSGARGYFILLSVLIKNFKKFCYLDSHFDGNDNFIGNPQQAAGNFFN